MRLGGARHTPPASRSINPAARVLASGCKRRKISYSAARDEAPSRSGRPPEQPNSTHLLSCDSEPVELLPRCVHFLECMDEKVHRLVLLPGAGQVVFGSGVEVEVI